MEINYDKDSNSDSSQSEQTSIIDSENLMLVSDQGTDSSSEEDEVKNNSMEIENDQISKKITEVNAMNMNNGWLKSFSENSGFIWDSMDPQPNSPLGYFRLFMNEEILKLILDQTTLYLNKFLDFMQIYQ